MQLNTVPVHLSEIHRFLSVLGLDCDINPCAAYVSAFAVDRVSDRPAFAGIVRAAGLTTALARILGIDEADVGVVLRRGPAVAPGDLAAAATTAHNDHPLRVSDVVQAEFRPAGDGRQLAVLKLNHLVADATDAALVFTALRGWFRGGGEAPPPRWRDHARWIECHATLPRADLAHAAELIGEVPPARRRGVPAIGATRSRTIRIADGLRFDDVLSSAAEAIAPVLGDDQVIHYPYVPAGLRDTGGCFTEIKPLVVRGADRGAAALRERRRALQALGRFDAAELTGFTRAMARHRVPRVVVSDTSLYQSGDDRCPWVPTVAARTFDDLKFLVDRGDAGRGRIRVQCKKAFLPEDALENIAQHLARRIGH